MTPGGLRVMSPVGGWATTEPVVPGQPDLPAPPAVPDWSRLSQDERWAQGQAVMKRWRSEHGDPPALRVALPRGPGSTLLFGLVRHDLGMIGLAVERVDMAADADLRLVDEVAAYDSALWSSEERRGGKECVSTCKSRWSPD